jgi:hypothetical protein
MSTLKIERNKSRFFNFKLFGKDIENDANTSRICFLLFFCYFLVFSNFVFEKWDKKLGNNIYPLFTILTE